jgi:hypothetical protein
VGSVVLSYRKPGAAAFATKPMTPAGGDTWRATLATDADGITGQGSLRFFVTATDTDPSPHTSRLPADTTRSIAVIDCANAGPVLASLKAAPGTVYTNLGACPSHAKTTTVSVNATDVDGVADVTLRYRLPGDGSYRTKAMTKSGDNWSAKVTPVDQRPNADGKASYYVQSQDKLGKSAKSGTRTFTVDRCNYPAVFGPTGWSAGQFPPRMCSRWTTTFYGSASDKDGLDGSSAVFVYTYVRTDGTKKTVKKRMSGSEDGPWYYNVPVTPGQDWNVSGATMTFYIQTTDKYGGVSKGGSGKITQQC